jgi:hypothetical protein
MTYVNAWGEFADIAREVVQLTLRAKYIRRSRNGPGNDILN